MKKARVVVLGLVIVLMAACGGPPSANAPVPAGSTKTQENIVLNASGFAPRPPAARSARRLMLREATAGSTVVPQPVLGAVSMTSSQVYLSKYVAHSFDYGFGWLDTEEGVAGYVPVLGRCGTGRVANPVTGYNTIGDCNGMGTLLYDKAANQLVVTNYSGQCGVQDDCPGQHGFPWPLGFALGTWAFDPSGYDPANNVFSGTAKCNARSSGCVDSGQTTDLLGRQWALTGPDTGGKYVWGIVGAGGPALTQTPAPTATPGEPPPLVTPVPVPTLTCADSGPYGGAYRQQGRCYNCAFQYVGDEDRNHVCGPVGGGATTPTPGPTLTPIPVAPPPTCPPVAILGISGDRDPTLLQLMVKRFDVRATYTDPADGVSKIAYANYTGGDFQGNFWFFSPKSTEIGVKIIDGRAVDQHIWIFLSPATNVAWSVTVRDTVTGVSKTYASSYGAFSLMIHDQTTFSDSPLARKKNVTSLRR